MAITSATLLFSILSLSLFSAPVSAQKVIGWVGDAPPLANDGAAPAPYIPAVAEAASTVAPSQAYETSMIYSPPTITTSYPDAVVTYPTAAPTGAGEGGSYPGYGWMMSEGYKSVDCGYGYQKDSYGKCGKMSWYSAETDFGCYETRIIKEKIHVTVKETVKQLVTVLCTVTKTATELKTSTVHDTATVTHTMTDTSTVAVPTTVVQTMTEVVTKTMTETATKLETATEVKTDIKTETAIKTVEVPVTLTKIWETTVVKENTLTQVNTLTSVWVSTATQTKTDLKVSTATVTETKVVKETALAQCIGSCSTLLGMMTTAKGYVASTYAPPVYATAAATTEALMTAAPPSKTGGSCPSAGCASGPVASKDSGSGGKVISPPQKRHEARSH